MTDSNNQPSCSWQTEPCVNRPESTSTERSRNGKNHPTLLMATNSTVINNEETPSSSEDERRVVFVNDEGDQKKCSPNRVTTIEETSSDHADGCSSFEVIAIPKSPLATDAYCLHQAVDERNFSKAWKLAETDEINHKDKTGATALHYAAHAGYPAFIELLIANGADPNLEDGDNITPLIIATDEGHLEAVRVLLEHGADVNHQMSDTKWTALHIAAQKNDWEMASLLLEVGANVHLTEYDGYSAYHYAFCEGHEGLANFIMRYQNKISAVHNKLRSDSH